MKWKEKGQKAPNLDTEEEDEYSMERVRGGVIN